MGGGVGEIRGAHGRGRKYLAGVLVETPERNRPLGRHGDRWEDNVKIGFTENNRKVWTGYVWFRVRISGWLL
jgi:hypothetical protein